MRSALRLVLFLFAVLPVAMAAPMAPTGLTGFVTSGTTGTLSWTDNSTDEASFLIGVRQIASGSYSLLATLPPNTTTYTFTGRAPATFYQFVVAAADAANDRAFSDIISLTTLPVFRTGYVNQAFTFSLFSADFPAVSTYAISALPPGLTLNPATGLISGTPTAAGAVNATVTTTLTNTSTLTRELLLSIFTAPPALQAPVATGPPANLSLSPGAAPSVISVAGQFSDPDAASAARLTTNRGTLDFVLYPGSAPQTVANFLGYVTRGDFANTIFHRSITNFIIQAGAFRADATASAGPTQPPVVNEPRISNVRGTIAMAKIGGNPDSATNQFFINLADNSANLDNQNEGFTVFGRIAGSGMAIADAIAALARANYTSTNGALSDVPVTVTPAPAVYNPANLVITSAAAVIPPVSLAALSSQPATATASLTGTDLTITPLAAGSTTISLTATDLDNQSTTVTFEVTVGDSFGIWAALQNFPTPADAAPEADPDKDGRPNLLEFALASAPLTSAPDPLAPGIDAGHLTFVFPLNNMLAPGTIVELQSAESSDGTWTTRWTNTDGFTHPWIAASAESGGITTVTARDPELLSANPRRFLRLKATRP